VLWEEGSRWVRGCVECGLEGAGPADGPREAWRETMEKHCCAHTLNR